MTQEQEHLDLDKSPLETIQSVGIFTQTEARHFLHFFSSVVMIPYAQQKA
jgi:hypothetical protein